MLRRLVSSISVAAKSIGSDPDDVWTVDWRELWPTGCDGAYAVSFDEHWHITESELGSAIRAAGRSDTPARRIELVDRLRAAQLAKWNRGEIWFERIYNKKKLGHIRWWDRFGWEIRVSETDDRKLKTHSHMVLMLCKNRRGYAVRLEVERQQYVPDLNAYRTIASVERFYKVVSAQVRNDGSCHLDLIDFNRSPEGASGLGITLMGAEHMRRLQIESGYIFSVNPSFDD